jgi:hypothetical protein
VIITTIFSLEVFKRKTIHILIETGSLFIIDSLVLLIVIAGIVVGILGMFIGVGIVVLFVLLRRRRRTKKEIQNTPTEQPSNQQIQEKNSTQDQEIPLQPISSHH